jgi:hypothetical protein
MIRPKGEVRHTFGFLAKVGTGSARLELAVLAFEDEPMRSRVAHVAHPLDEAALRLDDLEGVHTACWYSHFCKVLSVAGVSVEFIFCVGSES